MSYCRQALRLLRHSVNTARRYPANPGTSLGGLMLANMAYGEALRSGEPDRHLKLVHQWIWRIESTISNRMDAALQEIRKLREKCGEDPFGSPFERMGEP